MWDAFVGDIDGVRSSFFGGKVDVDKLDRGLCLLPGSRCVWIRAGPALGFCLRLGRLRLGLLDFGFLKAELVYKGCGGKGAWTYCATLGRHVECLQWYRVTEGELKVGNSEVVVLEMEKRPEKVNL